MTNVPNAVPLYGPEHAADPQRSYALLREQGPVGRAEIDPGVVVWVITGYRAALDLLQNPGDWSKNTRGWDTTVPPDSPVKQPLQWRPSLFFADGAEHAHLRKVITDSFALLDPQHLRDVTRRHADSLLDEFAHVGRADLVGQYARRLPLMVLNTLFGMPDEGADQLMSAIEAMMSTVPQAKEAGEQALTTYLGSLYAMKIARRGRDLTSWFIDHPHGLTPQEVINQVLITQGAAYGTLAGLIANTLAQILSDQRYRGTLTTGSLPIRHAIDEVLWADPPLAMYSLHRARRSLTFHGRPIKAGDPVMVSYAAVNTCPHTGQVANEQRSDYKAHLAFAAGPHACPAEDIVFVVSVAAIERLLGRLSDIELTVPAATLTYQPGPIYRVLTALPCRFTPQTPGARRAPQSNASASA
ncbi:cytochrome P450 family protein [Streptomyces chartreusis]|uniref:cytochrome P450 n=1 Tax=Streptomyces chartreusis TaxID=1969 RepID=UPI003802DCCA